MDRPWKCQWITLAIAAMGCSSEVGSAPESGATGAAGTAAAAPSSAAQTMTAPAAASGSTVTPTKTSPVNQTSGAPAQAPVAAPSAAPTSAGTPSSSAPASSPTDATTSTLPKATGGPISEACRGFSFDGILYSPGGSVLPNKCEAFHPTLNNPYAVRCVDVWPWFKTQYPGDQFCILPPTPDKGTQIGHHPQGENDTWFKAVSQGDMSGYESVPQGWALEPGSEEERNITIRHMNTGGKYDRGYPRMRGGSHHMIAWAEASVPAQTFTWAAGGPEGLFGGGTPVPGAQRPDDSSPQSLTVPEEDAGLYRSLAANAAVTFNMHHFNSTDRVILKEAWTNVWWSESPTTQINGVGGLAIEQAVGVFATPGQTVDFHYGYTVPGKMRVVSLFGHRHAWTTNFTVWAKRAGMADEILYQSFDWFDEPTYQYNSQVKNPEPNPAMRADSAHSGIVELAAGDELHFNCHIEYTDQRAEEVNAPVKPAENGPLRFANQAFNAEMCILWGGAVGQPGSIAQLSSPLPEFAKIR